MSHVRLLTGSSLIQIMSCPLSIIWPHNERHGISNHRRLDCLLNRLFRRALEKTSRLRVTGLCEGNPPVTGGFPSQRASDTENISIWWRHHVRWQNITRTNAQLLSIEPILFRLSWWRNMALYVLGFIDWCLYKATCHYPDKYGFTVIRTSISES